MWVENKITYALLFSSQKRQKKSLLCTFLLNKSGRLLVTEMENWGFPIKDLFSDVQFWLWALTLCFPRPILQQFISHPRSSSLHVVEFCPTKDRSAAQNGSSRGPLTAGHHLIFDLSEHLGKLLWIANSFSLLYQMPLMLPPMESFPDFSHLIFVTSVFQLLPQWLEVNMTKLGFCVVTRYEM